MSFLFLMIKIALVIYVIKFFWNVTFGLLALRRSNKIDAAVGKLASLHAMQEARTIDATAREVK